MNDTARRGNDCAEALLAFEVPSFGETILRMRHRLGLSRPATAAAAKLSASYYSDLEDCKRLAPPRSTALRVARALRMTELEASHLVSVAEAERAAALQDALLPPKVRYLMATIRAIGPQLPVDALDALQARLTEVPRDNAFK